MKHLGYVLGDIDRVVSSKIAKLCRNMSVGKSESSTREQYCGCRYKLMGSLDELSVGSRINETSSQKVKGIYSTKLSTCETGPQTWEPPQKKNGLTYTALLSTRLLHLASRFRRLSMWCKPNSMAWPSRTRSFFRATACVHPVFTRFNFPRS